MKAVEGLEAYFRGLEAEDKYAGVVLITQGDAPIFTGAHGDAMPPMTPLLTWIVVLLSNMSEGVWQPIRKIHEQIVAHP